MADAPNPFSGLRADATIPACSAAVVTPSDSTDLALYSRALYIGGAGNVTVDMIETGSTITFSGVAAGTLLPIGVRRVRSTGTTATLIISLR